MANDEPLYEARYDISNAARHLRMPRSTIAAWANGAKAFKRVLDLPKPGYLSFVNLTEAFVLFTMRRHYEIEMPRIRDAVDYVQQELGVDHPLAFQEFKTDKVDLFVQMASGKPVNVSRRGQMPMHAVLVDLERIEWQGQRPIALFPIVGLHRDTEGRRSVRISPHVAFGQPVIAGTGVPTRAVWDRFQGGESVKVLADDFGVSTDDIEEAVRAESDDVAA
ncbi:MAG TPA: DUF433 domain-containing protein [Candidatus Elarobacter sp.]|nr:DUF433 domain-containing protein [Candidatus Elarobacter sp.]